MQKLIFLVTAASLAACPAIAERSRALKLDPPANSKSLAIKNPKADNSCAAYGAGFVKIEGTNTCVQIGGSIGIGAGGAIRPR